MNAVLADLFGTEQIGGLVVELAELTDTGVIGFFCARAEPSHRFAVVQRLSRLL